MGTSTVTPISIFSRLKILWLSSFSFSENILISIREGDTETQWNIIYLLELKLSLKSHMIYSTKNLSSIMTNPSSKNPSFLGVPFYTYNIHSVHIWQWKKRKKSVVLQLWKSWPFWHNSHHVWNMLLLKNKCSIASCVFEKQAALCNTQQWFSSKSLTVHGPRSWNFLL